MPAPMSTPRPSSKRKRKQKGKSTVPLLPPEEDDVEVSEEDIAFVEKHKRYAGFLANLDPKKITKQVLGLKPDQDGDLETFYEKRAERTTAASAKSEDPGRHLTVDPVDALPVKSLHGELHYRTRDQKTLGEAYVSLEDRRAFIREARHGKKEDGTEQHPDDGEDATVEAEGRAQQKEDKKGTKAERRKEKKAAKRKEKEERKQQEKSGEPARTPPSTDDRMEEVESYISIQEKRAEMKARMAEIGTDLLANPEEHLPTLKELQDMCVDRDDTIAQLAMLSSMAVFKDLIPGYRIRVPTQKELEMPVSKEVRRQRDHECALLRYYQTYVQVLVKSAKSRARRKTALKCMCGLVDAAPHFNYRESLIRAIIPRMDSDDPEYRSMSCEAVRTIFENEAKHGGHATLEAVQLIADFVKLKNCRAHPDVVKVFLDLKFSEDLQKSGDDGDKRPEKKPSKKQLKESKRKKRELAEKLRKEVETDFKEAMTAPDAAEQRKLQTMTLSAVFEIYFRVLKTSLEASARMKSNGSTGQEQQAKGGDGLGPRPLLGASLEGLAKFSHLINVDFMSDLLGALRQLSSGQLVGKEQVQDADEIGLTPTERLQCCIIAFKIVRSNMDALNIDLREFYVQFFNLLYELHVSSSSRRNDGADAQVFAQALQVILWEGRQHDMQRTAAFVKRLATVALHVDVPEAMAALVTARQLLVRNKKCRNILENDGGGGAVGGNVAAFQLDSSDPDLSGALSSVLWEVSLLRGHYHPSLAQLASELSLLSSSSSAAPSSAVGNSGVLTATDAVAAYSTSSGGFRPAIQAPGKVARRKSYRLGSSAAGGIGDDAEAQAERAVAEGVSFSSHFRTVRQHVENERLRRELGTVRRSLERWEEYQKRQQQQPVRSGSRGKSVKRDSNGSSSKANGSSSRARKKARPSVVPASVSD